MNTTKHTTDLKREFVVITAVILWVFVGLLFAANSLFSEPANEITGATIGLSIIPGEFHVEANASAISCGVVNNSLTLTSDVSINGTCFTLNASNTFVDCKGFKVTYADNGTASAMGFTGTNLTNVTIKNCFIQDSNATGSSQHAIHFLGGGNHLIFNNTVNDTDGNAIYFEEGTNHSNISSNILRSSGYGIFIYQGSSNNTIDDNLVNASGLYAVLIHATVNDNDFRRNTVHGLGASTDALNFLSNINYSIVEHNTIISNSTTEALTVDGAYMSNFTNNTIISNTVGTVGLFINGNTNQTYFTNNNITTNQSIIIEDRTGDANQNYLVFNGTFGTIKWVDNGTGSFARNLSINYTNNQGLGIGRNIFIENNSMVVNVSGFNNASLINSSANVTIYTNYTTIHSIHQLTNVTRNSTFIINHGTNCYRETCYDQGFVSGDLIFNVSSMGSFAINGDIGNVAPIVTLIHPANISFSYNESISINFSTTNLTAPSIEYNLDNGTNTTITANTTFESPEGQHTLYLHANDSTGRHNYSSVQFYVGVPPNITLESLASETNSSSLQVPLNISIDRDGTIWYNLDNSANVTICTVCTSGNTTINLSDFGNHTLIIYANDSANDFNTTTFNFNLSIDTDGDGVPDVDDTDDDSDGIDDNVDNIVGNHTNVNARNFNSINFSVNNSLNITHQFSGLNSVNFTNGSHRFLEFFYNFSANQSLVLANITIQKQNSTDSFGSIIVRGINMTEGQRKTVYVDDLDADKTNVCIKDAEIVSVTEISSGCDGTNETKLECSAAGTTSGRYTCTDVGSQYKIEGLTHSGAIEVTATAAAAAAAGGGGGGGSGSTGGFALPATDDEEEEAAVEPEPTADDEEEAVAEEGNEEAAADGDDGTNEVNLAGAAFANGAFNFVMENKYISLVILLSIILLTTTTAVWVHRRKTHGDLANLQVKPTFTPDTSPPQKVIGPSPIQTTAPKVVSPQMVQYPLSQRKGQLLSQMKKVSAMISELKVLSKHQQEKKWKQKLERLRGWKDSDPFHKEEVGWVNEQLSNLGKIDLKKSVSGQQVQTPTKQINSQKILLPTPAVATSAEAIMGEVGQKLSKLENTLQKKLTNLKNRNNSKS